MVLRICCHLVPLQCDSLVLKLCHFIYNTLNVQQVNAYCSVHGITICTFAGICRINVTSAIHCGGTVCPEVTVVGG